jgi:hypothetical protein
MGHDDLGISVYAREGGARVHRSSSQACGSPEMRARTPLGPASSTRSNESVRMCVSWSEWVSGAEHRPRCLAHRVATHGHAGRGTMLACQPASTVPAGPRFRSRRRPWCDAAPSDLCDREGCVAGLGPSASSRTRPDLEKGCAGRGWAPRSRAGLSGVCVPHERFTLPDSLRRGVRDLCEVKSDGAALDSDDVPRVHEECAESVVQMYTRFRFCTSAECCFWDAWGGRLHKPGRQADS